MSEISSFFSHFDRWPLFLIWFGVIAAMIHAAQDRQKALAFLGLLGKKLAFAPPVYRKLKNALFLVGTFFALLASLGPQWGQKTHTIKAEGLDICFALDVSRSMLAEDLSPSRLAQAKNQLSAYLPRMGGDRAALVAFAGSGFVAAPLSVDHQALIDFLDPLEPDFITEQATNLAAGVDACLTALKLDEVRDRSEILDSAAKLIVLVTDGDDNVEDYKGALSRSEKLGIPIYAMALGTSKGGPIPLRNREGELQNYLKDKKNGQPVLVKLEDKAIKEITKRTGGKIFFASDGLEAWKKFENSISDYKRDSRDAGTKLDREERFQWPLLIAFLILVFDFLLSETRMRLSLGLLALALIPTLSARVEAAPNDVGAIYLNNKGVKAIKKNDLTTGLESLGGALARDATDLESRFNWATGKLLSSVQKPKDPREKAQVNTKTLNEATQELERILKETPPNREAFRKGVEYQLGQAYEAGNKIPEALESYYKSLSHLPTPELDQETKKNISRLLTMQDQSGGGGGGGQNNQDQKSDQQGGKDKNPQYGQQEQNQKPKFSGTEVTEDQARQILESVSGEEKEVQRRHARAQAKERAAKNRGERESEGATYPKPW